MRWTIWLAFAVALLAGCQQVDENPHWNPQSDLPPWTYDAPIYYRPAEELELTETIADNIGVYYTNKDYFFARHPSGYQLNGVPRIAVWCSQDEGTNWERVGYFGTEQTHFLFKADHDGWHWMRFVGPGQGVAEVPPGQPHRIYVVDTSPPAIELSVDPPPWETVETESGKKVKVPHIYEVGDTVTLSWGVGDTNLDSESIQLGVCYAKFPHNIVWSRWPETLPELGSMEIQIPEEAVTDAGLRFRIEASDKAGNVGVGLTDVLQIAGMEGSPTRKEMLQPVPPDLVRQAGGEPGAKPGWPRTGALLRGGTTRILAWMPESAPQYETLELHFSSNDGRIWRTVALDIKPDESVTWIVPEIISKRCRLRIVGINEAGQNVPLANTGPFIVDTVPIEGTDLAIE